MATTDFVSETTDFATDAIKNVIIKLSQHYGFDPDEAFQLVNGSITTATTSDGSFSTYKELIKSYEGNKNTGVKYELNVAVALLLGSKKITRDELSEEHKKIKIRPHEGANIIKIINLTQLDNVGGTGDIGVIYPLEITKYISITKWNGSLSKCIRNPSGRTTYGVIKTPELEDLSDKAYKLAIEARVARCGSVPSQKWKRFQHCPGAKMMMEHLASVASQKWNELPKEVRLKNIKKILDLDNKEKPNADGIAYWNDKSNCIEHIYKWKLKINLEDYLDTYSNGIYVYHGKPGDPIIKTQVKYNNGIIEGMSSKKDPKDWTLYKSKNYVSSWNANVPNIRRIFDIEEVEL